MNTRTRTLLIAGALAASASSLGSQAADQDAYFARQMALGSGDGNLLPDVVPPGADHAVAAAQVTDPESTDAGE